MAGRLMPQEALIYAMMTTSAVDRRISDAELSLIGSIIQQLPAFEGHDRDWLLAEAQDCGRVLVRPDGMKAVLDLIVAALPEHLRETAYALAAEVAASDLKIRAEEVRFLELLGQALELDKLICAALERAAKARHRKL